MSKKMKWFLIIGIVLSLVAVLFAVIFHNSIRSVFWKTYAFMHHKVNGKYLNNPYVDENYPDWKTIRLDNGYELMIPPGWQFEEKGETILVLDNTGSVIGYGVHSSRQTDNYSEIQRIVSERRESPIVSKAWDEYGHMSDWGMPREASIYLLKARHENGNTTEQIYLNIPMYEYIAETYYLFVIFESEGLLPLKEAEAIAWSVRESW